MVCNILTALQWEYTLATMHTLAIANQKGGTGKTTTVLNLGAGLAAIGWRVLLVDLDPQASLTQATAGDCSARNLADVLGDAKPGTLAIHAIIRNLGERLDLAPGDLALSSSELGLFNRYARESVLKRALQAEAENYDVCLIDCPPSMSVLTINALVAAVGVIAPVLPSAVDLRGLKMFLGSLETVREVNPALELVGVLVTQYDGRLNLHRQALEEIQGAGLPVLLPAIGRSVQVADAIGAGDPITRGPIADQYKEISQVVNQWLIRNRV
jgi:chromosome partitioning protein